MEVPCENKKRFFILSHIPWYTITMFIVYLSIYFTICTNVNDPRINELRIEFRNGKTAEIYRWYTYSFIHANAIHICMNMLEFCIFGTMVEYDHGFIRTLLIHFCAILGGTYGVGWESRITGKATYVIGESGGNFGLLSSQIGNLVLNWGEMEQLKRWFYVLILVSCTTSEIVTNILLNSSNVSYSAHIGGFIFGIFAGLTLMRNIRVYNWERKMQYVCGATFLGISIASTVNMILLH